MKRACLAAVLVAASALRLGTAWSRWPDAAFATGDEEQYWERGLALAKMDGGYGRGFPRPGDEAVRASLYPGFIALVARFAPPGAGPIRAAQALLGCATVLLLFSLTASVHSALAGLAAAGFLAVNASQISICADLNVHSFFTFLVLLAVCALARWLERPCARATAFLGLSLGVSLACRSTVAALPLAVLALIARLRSPGASKMRLALILLAASAAPLAPWTARNAWRLGEFVPFERGTSAFILFTASLGMVETVGFQDAYRLIDEREPGITDVSHAAYARRARRLALAAVAAAPARYLKSSARRLAALLGVYAAWFSPAFLAVMAFGAIRCRAAAAAPLGVLAYFFLIHALMSVNSRYLLESIPLACLLAGCGVAEAARLAVSALGAGPPPLDALLRRQPWNRRRFAAAGMLAGVVWTASVFFLAADLHAAPRPDARPTCAGLMAAAEAPASRGDWAAAERVYSEALRVDADCAQAYQSRGVARALLGRARQAVGDYNAAERIATKDPSSAYLLAAIRESRAASYKSLGWGAR